MRHPAVESCSKDAQSQTVVERRLVVSGKMRGFARSTRISVKMDSRQKTCGSRGNEAEASEKSSGLRADHSLVTSAATSFSGFQLSELLAGESAVFVLGRFVNERAALASDTATSGKLDDRVECDEHHRQNDQRRYKPDV